MAVRLSTAIMAHPKRLDAANNLARMVSSLNPKVVIDANSTAGTLETSRRGWTKVGDDSTRHMVLQDDISTRRDFATQAERLAADGHGFTDRSATAQHVDVCHAWCTGWNRPGRA